MYLDGSVVDVADHKTQGPDWKRLSILFLWYLMGIPIALTMQNSCSVNAPGTWARAGRVFIEGVVAFGLGGFIYVGIKVLRRLRFIFLRLTGAGPMSVPNLPFTPSSFAVRTRKSATYSPVRRQVRWGGGVCINICPSGHRRIEDHPTVELYDTHNPMHRPYHFPFLSHRIYIRSNGSTLIRRVVIHLIYTSVRVAA